MRTAILTILLSAPALIAGAATDGCGSYAPAIERALRTSGVPGVAVGIVVGDRVVCSRGFGARDLARKLPVTRETEFYIASAAKPFTALAVTLVALDGKLDIDAPLDRTLPSLRLPSPLDPARMSLRDLLTHRLGFRNDGYVWRTAYSGEWTEAVLFDVLAKSTLVTPRQFDYTNLGYDLAGFALTHATGQPWQSVVTERVLRPAGLRHTYTRASEIETENVAVPYGMVGSAWVAATPKSDATMQPAGGFYTDIDDFVRWVSVNMHKGLLDGKRVYGLRAMRDVHAPQIDLDRKFGRIHRHSYSLGWYHGEYDGDLLIHHFGSYPGAWAHSSYMPERKIGIAVLSNAETPLSDSIALYVYDVLIGKKDAEKRLAADAQNIHDSLAKMPERLTAMREKIAASSKDSSRESASYTGTYRNDALGTMTIQETAGNLIASMGLLKAPMDRVRGDTFLVQWLPGDRPEQVTFTASGLTGDDDVFVKDPSP